MGEIYFEEKNFEQAQNFLQQVVVLAQEHKNYEQLSRAHQLLKEVYLIQKSWR